MDYTVRPWNNLMPGAYNLNLLETLYGTPARPLLADPFAEVETNGGTAPPTAAPWRPPPPMWNRDNEKEEEDEGDRRRRLQDKVALASANCRAAQCMDMIDEEYVVVTTKLLV